MKEFARQFYNSKRWKQTREIVIKRHFGLCNRCMKPGKIVHHIIELTPKNIDDTRVSLNPDNLELLCHECHDNLRYETPGIVRPGYEFDQSGRVVPKQKL